MRGIEQVPALYDAGMAVLDRGVLGRWRRSLVQEDASGPLLEVGCGTGRTLRLHPRGAGVVGIDPDRGVLRSARRKAPGALLVQARAEALPFREGAFGTVVSSLVFCSVDEPEVALGEVARVLRPGGSLRMLEHVRPRTRVGGWIASIVRPGWKVLTGGCRPDRDTVGTVEGAGYRIDPGSVRSWWVLRRFDAWPPHR